MQVWHHATAAGDGVHQVVASFGGFQAAQANAEVARETVDLLHKVPKPGPLFLGPTPAQVDAVVSKVDARQHDFLAATGHQLSDFSDNVFARTAAQSRPDRGNDAEGAVKHAAVLHFDKRPLMAVEPAD